MLLRTPAGPGPIRCGLPQADASCPWGGPGLDSATGTGQGLRDLLASSGPAGPVGLPALCIAASIEWKVAAGQRRGAA